MFSGKRIVVTGGTGLIGQKVAKKLCDAGAKVFIVSLDDLIVDTRATHIFADLSRFELCKEVTEGIDYVFHIAGVKGSVEVTRRQPASFFVPLLMMNTNILEACRLNQVKKVLFTSSIGAYADNEILKEDDAYKGEPMDTYPGWAKRMAEFQINAYKTQYGLDSFVITRLTAVYGEGDNFDPNNAMVIPSLIAKIVRGDNPIVIWGDGSPIRDFAYSEDIANGILLAMQKGKGLYNLGSGRGYSIRNLVETLQEITRFNYEFDSTKPSGAKKRVMDISKAQKELGYSPRTSLAEGLTRTYLWFAEHKGEYLKRKNYFTEVR